MEKTCLGSAEADVVRLETFPSALAVRVRGLFEWLVRLSTISYVLGKYDSALPQAKPTSNMVLNVAKNDQSHRDSTTQGVITCINHGAELGRISPVHTVVFGE